MPVEGVDFGKILALLPLKMLIFLKFIPAKQGFHSSISLKFEMQELKLFQDKRQFFWYNLFCRCKGLFFAANFVIYVI